MENKTIQPQLGEIDNKKCYSCGKIFRTPANLQTHKNRKTPCLIIEVAPDQVKNPNRCIFCNRIYSTKGNLMKHSAKCKIKNGGMEILADKVKYDQKIRILEEQNQQLQQKDKEKDEQIKQLAAKIEALEKSVTAATPQQIVNNNYNAPVNNFNITINNYLKPNLTYLFGDGDLFRNTFKEYLVQTPMAIIPLIWFNPEHPENFSIYLVNKSTKETLTYDGSDWNVTTADKVTKEVRDRAYEITDKIISNPTLKLVDKYTQYIPAQIVANSTDEEQIKLECEKVYNQFMQNRELVKPHVKLIKK